MVSVADCALAFQKLLDIQYEFHLAHKRRVHCLRLRFTPNEFFHLAGLHKIHDFPQLKRSPREQIFRQILENPSYFDRLLLKSPRYPVLQSRLVPLFHLESLLDSDHLIFQYRSRNCAYSKIEADYIISGQIADADTFVFLANNQDHCQCCSIFQKGQLDFTKQQMKFTILLKKKLKKSSNRVLYEYKHPKYEPAPF